jgi:hypothetical protein
MSFMKTMNKRGSKIDPWGTPTFMSRQLDMITKNAFSRVNIFRKFKFILDRKTLEAIYITFIRPLLEYADVVLDTKTQILINKLENVQSINLNFLKMLTRENAFLVIMSICLFHLPSSESCSPRCLCSVTVLMIVLFTIGLG